MPDGYGAPDSPEGLLSWASVEDRLVASAQYWMATTRIDGRPHVVPRWGAWVDGRLYYDGSPDTVHARNLAANPACVLHLEDGWKAVVVEGTSRRAEPPPPGLAQRISAGFTTKYADRGYSPGPDSWDGPEAGGLLCFTPAKAMAWFDFPHDVTRFRF